MTRTFTLALALAASLGGTTAFAQPADRNAEFRVNDLDLSSSAGQAELDRRISSAARKICGDGMRTGSNIPDRTWLKSCKAQVRAQVTEQVGLGG